MKFTQEGLNKLQGEKEALLLERVSVLEDVKKSREMGDLSENGYYKASKSRLRFIDSQVMRLDRIIKESSIIEKPTGDTIGLGSKVTLRIKGKQITYLLVDGLEAQPSAGNISYKSPLGKSLLGKKTGDTVIIQAPNGESTYIVEKLN